MANKDIKAIFFDMNGTLRQRVHDEMWQRQSVDRLWIILEKPDASEDYLFELRRRYKTYTRWADDNHIALPEEKIWTQWITPDLPRERIEPRAAELMLTFRNCKGRSILKPGSADVLKELKLRGYRLGVISNTTSTKDLPSFMDEYELTYLFEVVVLSSIIGIRKPSAGIFEEAACRMHLAPAECAYLGNKIANDIIGAHKAGFASAILIVNKDTPIIPVRAQIEKPDVIIYELTDLLDVFPPRSQK